MPSHYRPVLWARQGELQALEELSNSEQRRFTPIILVPPREWNFDKNEHKKSFLEHLESIPENIGNARRGNPAYIDIRWVSDEINLVDGVHPLLWLVLKGQERGVDLWPVLSPNSPESTIEATRDAISLMDEPRLAIRAMPNDWPATDEGPYAELIESVGIATSSTDLMLDLGEEVQSGFAVQTVIKKIAEAGALGRVGSLTVGGAGMPADFPANKDVHVWARYDWSLYTDVLSAGVPTAGGIDYLDYGVSSPSPGPTINPKYLSISAKFRYTTDNSWLLVRGGAYKASGNKSQGGKAVAPMLEKLVAHQLYRQQEPDATHDWIDSVLAGASGGTPTTWQRWATYHHVKKVISQLSS